MKTLRFGFIGGGEIACLAALPGITRAAGVELVAMADVTAAVRELWSKAAPTVRVYDDAAKLLADPAIEAVYIALPNSLHREWTIKAAQAGKHVLCEKPLATNTADALEMVNACETAGVTLMVAYMSLFNPLIEPLEAMIASGKLGRIHYVHGQYAYPLPPREGVWRMDPVQGRGPLFDVGIYPIFMTRHLLRQPWRHVAAFGTKRWWKDSPVCDTVVASGELADGTLVSVETAFTHGGGFLNFEGEKGTLTLEKFFARSCMGHVIGSLDGMEVDWAVNQEQVFRYQNYQREFEHLAECVRRKQETICSGRIALDDCAALDAIVESMETGKRVSISMQTTAK